MARRAELFVRELSDEEAALLKLARPSRNPTVQHRAMLLFASFQGQSVSQIAVLHRASATHVAELIHAFNAEGFAALDPRPRNRRHRGRLPDLLHDRGRSRRPGLWIRRSPSPVRFLPVLRA